ncbi:MAG: glycosyltransferase family 2 protein [Deltaproteobacteria bacterium]|nr:glycosyltransferase family 2 protein [Deltaproteobacteria bacterium]
MPISVVIPTVDRPQLLGKSLETFFSQDVEAKEIVVIDASDSPETLALFQSFHGAATVSPNGLSRERRRTRVVYRQASARGAACQRNEGVEIASQPFILFMDDDVELQQGCLAKLWSAMISDERIGGVSSMILNQKYTSPGLASRVLYFLVSGEKSETFAGRCLGPVLALLPEDRDELPEVVPVEWLNTTCTLYRREALPMPVFPSHFTGYSMAEDINLSLTVGKAWKLVNARTARIFHNSGSGPYKPTGAALAKMSLINRHYIMTKTLGRTTVLDYAKLVLVEAFGIVTSLRYARAWAELPAILLGKVQGILTIATGR